MTEEETREDIIDIINNEETVKEEHINVEKPIEEVKPKAKSESRAKPKIKIVKESVEPVVEPIVGKPVEPIVEKPVEEQPKK